MKTRILIVLIAALVFGLRAEAQICVQQISSGKQIILGRSLPAGNINTLFGVPQKIRSHEDEAAGGYMMVYEYSDFIFSTVDGEVYSFGIDSKNYLVTIFGRYKVKLGDKLSTFLKSIPAGEADIDMYPNEAAIRFKVPTKNVVSDEALILKANSQGIIIDIWWYSPV